MSITRFGVQLRSRVDGNTLVGHAAVFGQAARVASGLERMAPEAFDRVLQDDGLDVVATINHDVSMVLGRSKSGTLKLGTDSEGLTFEVDLPDTSYANDLRTLMTRGDITGASFGFIPGEYRWDDVSGTKVMTHMSVGELVDVSVVTRPAYAGADVVLRSYDFDPPNGRSQLVRARARVLKERSR